MLLQLLFILIFMSSFCSSKSTYRQEQCVSGTDLLTAATSCREIIANQPDCLDAHASGVYWISEGGSDDGQQEYCDLSHSGGGWIRIINFHHNGNSSCPSFPEAESITQEWEGLTLANGSIYCVKGGWREDDGGRSVVWNSARNVSYSEVRGYAQLRLISVEAGSVGQGDGFKGPNNDIWDDDYADGLSIEIPETDLRHIFSYIIGSETRKCPEASGVQGPPYLNNGRRGYLCGHVTSGDDIDENGVYQISPHDDGGEIGTCQYCPSGSPWFHHYIGEHVNHPIRLRLTDYISYTGIHIAVAELELYVR